MKNKKIIKILGISAIVLGLFLVTYVVFFQVKEPVLFSPPSCSGLGDSCSSNSQCCPSYLTDHGVFYGYCSGTCKVADGINGNLDVLEWCGQYSSDNHYRTFKGYDFLGWDQGISCYDLFPEFASSPFIGGGIGFTGTYDYLGNRVKTHDENRIIIETNFYDNLGYKNGYASQSLISGLVVSSIDPIGRLHESKDANGNYIKNYYDNLDRLIKTESYNSENQNDFTIEYCYDEYCGGGECSDSGSSLNLLCELKDNSGKEKYLYDERDRLSWKEKTIYSETYEDRIYTLNYEYDSANNIIGIILPDNSRLDYTYNSLGQITNIIHDTAKLAELSYNAAGMIELKRLGMSSSHPIHTGYFYNDKNQLIGIKSVHVIDTIFQRALKYDKVGNVQTISYSLDLGDPSNILSDDESYVYDNLYRLKTANYLGDINFDFDYLNLWGDRNTKTIDGQVTSYDYENFKLESFTDSSGNSNFVYDDNGNIISETNLDSNILYEYDSLNRLIEVKINEQTDKYVYDYTNQRIIKETDKEVTFYLYQGNNVIYEETFKNKNCGNIGEGQCSGYDYCYDGELVDYRCDKCGCPSGQKCEKTGARYECVKDTIVIERKVEGFD